MKATFSITDPARVECTMTITMPLAKWEKLSALLDNSGDNTDPVWELKCAIRKLSDQATQAFRSNPVPE